LNRHSSSIWQDAGGQGRGQGLLDALPQVSNGKVSIVLSRWGTEQYIKNEMLPYKSRKHLAEVIDLSDPQCAKHINRCSKV